MKKRLNITLDITMDEYCQQQAEILGISKNGFINVALAQYKQQNDMFSQIPSMTKLMEQYQLQQALERGQK